MGKVHKRNEFGVKVKIAMTNRSNFVVVRMVLPDNPYDGHTFKRVLEQTCRLNQKQIDEVFMDRDCRRHSESLSRIYVSGQKRGITTRRLERSLKRRQAVKLVTGTLKSDRLLVRNRMKGICLGDQINALLCCASHNLRLELKRFDFSYPEYLVRIAQWMQCLRSLNRRIEEFESGRKYIDDGAMELLPLQQAPTAA